MAYNGYFAKNCFHPLFCFTSEGDCLGVKLRPGNVHSADGALEFIKPIVERYRGWFKLFWFRGDAAFANPETYEYCEEQRITYFIRLPSNAILMRLLETHLNRPVGRPPKSGIQVRIVDPHYQAKSWSRPRRVMAKIRMAPGRAFPQHRLCGHQLQAPCRQGNAEFRWPGRDQRGIRSKARTPCAGTRPVAKGSRPTRPG